MKLLQVLLKKVKKDSTHLISLNPTKQNLFRNDAVKSRDVGGEKSVEGLVERLCTRGISVYHQTHCSIHVVVHKQEYLGK